MCHGTLAVQGVLGGCAWEVVCMCHGTLAYQSVWIEVFEVDVLGRLCV